MKRFKHDFERATTMKRLSVEKPHYEGVARRIGYVSGMMMLSGPDVNGHGALARETVAPTGPIYIIENNKEVLERQKTILAETGNPHNVTLVYGDITDPRVVSRFMDVDLTRTHKTDGPVFIKAMKNQIKAFPNQTKEITGTLSIRKGVTLESTLSFIENKVFKELLDTSIYLPLINDKDYNIDVPHKVYRKWREEAGRFKAVFCKRAAIPATGNVNHIDLTYYNTSGGNMISFHISYK